MCIVYPVTHSMISLVQSVLEDIFAKRGMNHETVMIKSDNAPTQYKNKLAFGLMQHLADKYNFTLIRVHGSAGHDKGVIDAISSFGVKNILCQSTITNVWLFENSLDI